MYLELLVIVAVTSLAQSTDARIGSLSRQVSPRILANRVPSVGERLGDALDQTRANLAKIENRLQEGPPSFDVAAALHEERQKLAVLDEAYQREFATIESKLRRAGLTPRELAPPHAARGDFTAHYKKTKAGSQAGVDLLSREAANHDAAWVRAEVAKLRVGLGAAAPGQRSGVADRGAGRLAPRVMPAAVQPTLATDPPTPEDLAPNGAVVLTPDIVAQAAGLGNSPAALFAYVYNTVQFAPYYMLVQNSESVLWSGKGNDADQATLLIALLRASGIPARYAMGHITVPVADAINWMGVKDKAAATAFLKLNTIETDQGSSFDVVHVWVEAWLNTSTGDAWVPMTPSIKRQTFQPGLSLTQPAFNRTQFLGTVQSSLASEVYASQLLSTFQQTYPGQDFSAAAYTGTITPVTGATLPTFPYPITQVNNRGSSLPAHSIGVILYLGSTTYFSQTLSMPLVSTESVTLSFTPATAADQSTINSFGGLANTPAGMVKLLPQLRVNEVVTATGSTAIPYAKSISLEVTHTESFQTSPAQTYGHTINVGDNIAVTVGYNQISDRLVASRTDAMLSQVSTAASDVVTRELLSLAGIRYFQRLETEKQRVFVPLQILPVLPFPEECLTGASVQVINLFDRPFLATPASVRIDAQGIAVRAFDLNAGGVEALSVPADLNVSRAAEAASSGLENQLWEELVLIPSISTIKALQMNTQNNTPMLVINSAAGVATVKAPSSLASSLTSEIAAGATITISQQATVFGVWTGFGWIEDYANAFAFEIEQTNTPAFGGGTNGGNPAQPTPPTGDPGQTGNPTNTNGVSCSDPVTVSNGNMYQQQTDLNISSRGPAIAITRTYNSIVAATSGPFGFGWTHNYLISLKDNQTSVAYTNESGGVFSFALQGGNYISPPGLNLTLTKSAQGYAIRSRHGTLWTFNATGVLQSITDRNHNATTLGYQGGLLTTITDALGRMVTLTYDASNRIVTISDFAGRSITYTYSAGGDLASVTDAAGNVTQYVYYTASPFAHRLQTTTKPAGNSTSYEYYVNGQTARVSDSAGRNMRFFYLPFAGETLFIDPRGFTSTFYFNTLGNVIRMIKADGNYRDYGYTSDAKLASMTDEDGFTTSYTYDGSGNVTSITDALGKTVHLTFEPTFNQVASITDALGGLTQFQYDANGNLSGISQPLSVNLTFTFDSFGEMLTATDGMGNTTSSTYDQSGNLFTVTDPLTNATQYQYDNLRRRSGRLDALGNQASWQWDVLDRLTATIDPIKASWSRAYDGNSNLAQSVDANGNQTSYSYDALDNLAQVKDALGAIARYSYVAPTCGCMTDAELTGFQNGAGVSQFQSYDSNLLMTQSVDAAGNASSFLYDARGDLVSKTDPNGNTIQYKYDGDGRMVKKTFPDGSVATLTYDASGNVMSATNANTTVTFTYDALNRVTAATDSRFGQTITYAYDNGSRRIGTTDPFGATTVAYDANNRLTSIVNPSGDYAQFVYDALNRRMSLKYSNGLSTASQYDAASHLTGLATTGAGPQFNYSYDPNGNPTAVADAAGMHVFQFDQLNRVGSAAHPSASPESYSYDGAGNRTASASGGYQYDATGRLTGAEGLSFTYDKNSNLIGRTGSGGTTTYAYDFENRLIAITFPDGTGAAYLYDALGRRIQKNVNGTVTNYLYDEMDVLLELSQSGAMLARYTRGPNVDQMLTMERGGQTYFYHTDSIGSIATLTNSSGSVACSYSYDSFGRTQPCSGVINPFGFAGREYDSESALYYMRARYYDPATGRFITPDPWNLMGRLMLAQHHQPEALYAQKAPQELNVYSYAINNPLVFRDPSGLGSEEANLIYSIIDHGPAPDPCAKPQQPPGPFDTVGHFLSRPFKALYRDWEYAFGGDSLQTQYTYPTPEP